MRTKDEIAQAFKAAGFALRYRTTRSRFYASTTIVEVTKGSPPIFICAEQAQSLHLPGHRVPLRALGPVSRMTMAMHLNLTPEEAEIAGLTAHHAQEECMAECRAIVADYLAKHPEAREVFTGEIHEIQPHDPRWGRTQTEIDESGEVR